MRTRLLTACLFLSWSLGFAQWQMNLSPLMQAAHKEAEQEQVIRLTADQARALLKIAEERRLCNELVDKLQADLADIERRAASADAKLADMEQRIARIQAENEQLAKLLADSKAQVKEIQNTERKRRWRWLGYGALIGAGAVAALAAK